MCVRFLFLLNHAGLFVALLTATLGNADMQRLKMITQLGKTEWRAIDEGGKLTELPLAVELKEIYYTRVSSQTDADRQ